jgi:hypothetical protein
MLLKQKKTGCPAFFLIASIACGKSIAAYLN